MYSCTMHKKNFLSTLCFVAHIPGYMQVFFQSYKIYVFVFFVLGIYLKNLLVSGIWSAFEGP